MQGMVPLTHRQRRPGWSIYRSRWYGATRRTRHFQGGKNLIGGVEGAHFEGDTELGQHLGQGERHPLEGPPMFLPTTSNEL